MIWYWLKKAHPSFLCFWCTINFAARSAVTLRLFTSSHFASVCVCVTVKICSMTSWEAASSKWMPMWYLGFTFSSWETWFFPLCLFVSKSIFSLVHLRAFYHDPQSRSSRFWRASQRHFKKHFLRLISSGLKFRLWTELFSISSSLYWPLHIF